MTKLLRTVFTLVFINCMLLASAYSIKGKIIDVQSAPEAYATVRIFNVVDTLHAAALGVTDDDGAFNLPLKSTGVYNVMISSVGKKTIKRTAEVTNTTADIDLGTMTIEDNAAELGEVNVVARKPLVVKEIDRIGYDVQADEDSKTSTVQDVLRKVPMVTVEADGTIKVKGSTNFKIYKDGRPNNAFTNNAKDIFAAIPASLIKKIEVITDPGAKEDAEGVGAILNIVTNQATSLNGLMGNVSITWSPNNNAPMPNVWLQGNVNKVALSAYGGYFHQDDKLGRTYTTSENTYVESGNKMSNSQDRRAMANGAFWGIDGSYELDSLNLFTLEFGGFYYYAKSHVDAFNSMTDPAGNLLYSYGTMMKSPRTRFLDFHGNFNYQRSTRLKGETITLSYQVSTNKNATLQESEYVDLYNFPAPYSGINSDASLNFMEHTGQIDWTRPFGAHNKISVGAKVIARSNSSDTEIEYVGVGQEHTDFKHNTTIGAGYFDYRYNIGKFNARAGLRYEYSRLSAKFKDGSSPDFGSSLNDWVPNASFMYNLNDASTLKLSYATRINRPGINFLNPAETYSPTSLSYGNPDLESVHYSTFSLNYSLIKQKFNLDATLSYSFADNSITTLTTVDENDFTTSTFDNIGNDHSWDLSLFGQWSVTPITTLMLNGNVYYQRLKIPDVSNSRWGASCYFRATQLLPWKLRLEGFLFYDSGRLQNVYSYQANTIKAMFHGFSLQRTFLKEERLTAKVQLMNPFSTHGMGQRTITNRGDYTGWSFSEFSGSRGVMVSVSYRFGSVSAKVKKSTAEIVNDDLQGGNATPSAGQGMMPQ